MRKKTARRPNHSNAFGIAVFVGGLIGLLILAAVSIKVILVFHASKFDGKHQFVLEIKEPSKTEFAVFDPDSHAINTLDVHDTSNNISSLLAVPVDAVIATDDDHSLLDIINTLPLHGKQLHTQMTLVDAVNLFIFTHAMDTAGISQTLSPADDTQDSKIAKVFEDDTLYREGKSIAVVNGADISGLGNSFGRMISHVGGNVVSITNADKQVATSSVTYTGELSYTATRLSHMLGMPLVRLSGVSISDITVIIGEDQAHFLK